MEQQLIPYTALPVPEVAAVLVLAPHPDDEIFGCGGALALHVGHGAGIFVIILTDGAAAGDEAVRLEESRQAARAVGYPPPGCWHLPDRGLQYGEELVARILQAMADTGAGLVYAPSLWENHPDHRATGLAALEACRRHGAAILMQYEISAPLRPNYLIDITAVLEKKKAAMACFFSQLAQQSYDRHISALNTFRTFTLPATIQAAEAFEQYTPETLRRGVIPFLLSEYQRQHAIGLISMPEDIPLVSVLVRSMNRPSLDAALASVAVQTWPCIEVVVINAAGAGHRPVPAWCGRFPLRLVDNRSQVRRSHAANLALEQARGEYLLFLDDDDLLEGDHIAKLAERLCTDQQLGIVHTGVRGVDPEGRTLVEFTLDAPRSRLLLSNFMPMHAVLFRRVFVQMGCRFDETLDVYEDWDFWLQLTGCGVLGFVPGISAVYNLALSADHPVHNHAEQAEATLKVLKKWEAGFTLDTVRELRHYAEQVENGRQQLLIELASRRGDIERLTAEHHRLIADHQAVVAEHHRLIEDHQTVVAEHRLLVENYQILAHKHQACRAELQQLYDSRSWQVTAPLRALGAQVRKLSWLVRLVRAVRTGRRVYRQEGLAGVQRKISTRLGAAPAPVGVELSGYGAWLQQHDLLPLTERTQLMEQMAAVNNPPVISIVMPTYNPDPEWLSEAIESVLRQSYQHWELCIADDASSDQDIRPLLEQFSTRDGRIKVVFRETNGHIAVASNSALALATGDFVTFLDHDDCLHPDALLELAGALTRHDNADLLYTDEDKLSPDGTRCLPFFKPDWSPHLAISQAYLGHLVCYRHSLLQELGGLSADMAGAQDYDLWLRASLKARTILHIPRVLYHWRMHYGSTALAADAKPYAHEVGRRAVEAYLRQRYPVNGPAAADGAALFTYAAGFKLPHGLLVSIIIPTRNGLNLLQPCIDSILTRTTWHQFEIIVIDNGSDDPQALRYLQGLPEADQRIRVIKADIPFNWSQLNNIGAQKARGDVLIFLNNDTLLITPDWIQNLAGYALLPDVGLVGGLLLFEDGTIQHSGVVVGMGGWADHLFRTMPAEHSGAGPFISPVLTRNVLAVTGACMVIERKKFNQLGGFDESFIICGSDVELGLRAYQQGLYNVICAEARLYHLESKTRTPHIPEDDFRQSAAKYEPYRTRQTDPFYNPNLSLTSTVPLLKDDHAANH